MDVVLGACLCLGLGATRVAGQTVYQVKNVDGAFTSSDPEELTAVSNGLLEPSTLFFAADDGVNGSELWKSDGTEAGTTLVRNIYAGSASGHPMELTHVAGGIFSPGRLFFIANDGAHGAEIWKSDGTFAGTQLVKDILPTAGVSSHPSSLTAVSTGGFGGARLFFVAYDGTSGVELWTSDGTAAGTVRVKDIVPGSGSSNPSQLTAVGSTLYFTIEDLADGRELWKSDGTEAGTVQVKDIYPGGSSSSPSRLTNVNGTLYFVAMAPMVGVELWKSDGTAAGTVMVKDIRTGNSLSSSPAHLVAVGSTLFFQADDGISGRELWKSDGTAAGTVMVANINPAGDAFTHNDFDGIVVNAGGTLFFVADDGTTGEELWKSDGTAAGTVLVKDIYQGPPGVFDAAIGSLTHVNGIVFFGARDVLYNHELWRTDGRAEGTFQVGELVAGTSADAAVFNLTIAGRRLFFSAYHLEGNELMATDVVFDDGFEAGLGRWSSASTDGGDLAVEAAAALHGTVGLAAHVDDTAGIYVVDESPNNELRYRARFYLDPNGFDPGEANGKFRVRIFIAFEEEPNTRLVTLVLRRIGGQYSLMGRVRLDDGTRAQTPFFAITDEPHLVELDWTWSEGSDANNGTFGLWIDEVPVAAMTGLDNAGGAIDFVRLGVIGVKPGANGTLLFDDFESRRERYIGPAPE